jgi:copper resistance protein B
VNLAAQNVPQTRIGAGISNAELGLRLRYEIKREFAPYIGVSYDRKLGQTAGYARADGKDVEARSFVIGVRTWF